MNIVLIGYRGTGKSVVAKLLSNSLAMQSISMDAEIAGKAGFSIPQIVEKYGWGKFRDLESELTVEISQLDNIIVDTGGGVIERRQNVENLKKNGLVFWLKASVDVIVSRIAEGSDRPALTAGKTFTEEVAEILSRRTAKYAGACDHEIDTNNISPEQVAAEIVALWNQKFNRQA